ncbi:MAG: replication-relaxation family protein, partial [Acidimicrobiia bacterium]
MSRRLTDRDRAILSALGRHRVFTSVQLTEMFFDSQKRALWRLLELYRMTAVDRFQPYRPGWGAYPYHYVLGRLGVVLVAATAEADANTVARRWRPDRGLALGRPERLARLVGLNGFCAALVAHARRHPGSRLLDWMTEAEVCHWVDRMVAPHAYGQWCQDGVTLEFFVEWDRLETAEYLRARVKHYAELETDRGTSTWVLFAFPSARREAAVRAALADATVPVATTVAGDVGPDSAVWWPLSGHGGRVRLVDLAGVPKPPEAVQRTASGSLRD